MDGEGSQPVRRMSKRSARVALSDEEDGEEDTEPSILLTGKRSRSSRTQLESDLEGLMDGETSRRREEVRRGAREQDVQTNGVVDGPIRIGFRPEYDRSTDG